MDDRNAISLTRPEKRDEILLFLRELAADNPERLWSDERKRGLSSGIDQVFHFFFDDNDFDERAVGESLSNREEVQSIKGMKSLLDAMLSDLPDGDDSAFVNHALWACLHAQAQEALNVFEARG